ncbi:unnamed protein product [Ilex paraguariensis]|uniref:Uncharacterized protein n=1 Tax=Ilex paraguariensis TaxID=185542 RepID=A0ABC8U631_9AQUA
MSRTLEYEQNTVTVNQVATGKRIQDKPEWNVTIANPQTCTLWAVKLSCPGFQTVEKVDPLILSKSGDICTINNDLPIYGYTSINFTYAWDHIFPMKQVSSKVACS